MNATLTPLSFASRLNANQTAAREVELGWAAMSALSFGTAENDGATLGWNAMPAYGQVTTAAENAELVANIVATTRPTTRLNSLSSFWSTVSQGR